MKLFVPPGGIAFPDAFDMVHRRMFGDEYVPDRTMSQQNAASVLRQRLRIEGLSDVQREEIRSRLDHLNERLDTRSDQVRAIWQWWRGQLYNGAPPTRLLGVSGATLDVSPIVWGRDDFRGDAFSGGRIRFYQPGYSDALVGVLFFWKQELVRSLDWACAQPDPFEAHASWSEIELGLGEASVRIAPPSPAVKLVEKPAMPTNKTAWLSDQLGPRGLDTPMRSASVYRDLARRWAELNGDGTSPAELVVGGKQLSELHRKHHPKRARKSGG
jgi:hypothetical protein